MAGRQDARPLTLKKCLHRDPRQFACRSREAEVELLVLHPLPNGRGPAGLELNRNTGMATAEGLDDGGKKADRQGRQSGDPKRAGRGVANVLSRALEHGNPRKAALNLMKKDVSFRRHRQRDTFGADKELEANLMFEVRQKFAHSGLRDVQRRRRLRYGAGQHHRAKGFQLTEIHICASQVIRFRYSLYILIERKL